MANTPPRPVLPPPPSVGAAKPVAAPVVVGVTDVDPVPDAWFTDFEAEPAPASTIATEAVELTAARDESAALGALAPDDRPRDETRVPTLPLAPSTATPTDTASPRRTTQMVAGGIAVLAVIVLVIRCAGGPANDVATRDDAIARAGGGAQDPAEHPIDASRTGAAATAEHADADARDSAAKESDRHGDAADEQAGDDEAAKAEAAKAEAAQADAAKAEAAQADAANTDAVADDVRVDEAADARTDTAAADATPASTASKPSGRTDSAASASTRSAEAQLTAEELLALARAAWKAGNARDTYKFGNKSRYKQPSAEATELVTLAACKMKQDDAAKATFKDLDGDRRKRVRNECRELGVRVGL